MNQKLPIFLLFSLVSAGCATLPDNRLSYQEPLDPLALQENNARLKAVENLVNAGKGNAAKQQADLINPAGLSSQQEAKFNLMSAQILLSFGEAEQAASKLANTKNEGLSAPDKIKYFQSQAFAYSLTGNQLESGKARIALDGLLTTPDERKKNQAQIMEALGYLPPSAVQGQSADFVPWFDIAAILEGKTQEPASFNASLARWQAANPGHPANLYVATVKKLPETAEISPGAPQTIAVFLPESGSYADAGKAVKAGFMAAFGRSNQKPTLHFYNTDQAKAADLYKKAVNEGATLVIGPLNKDSIQGLAKIPELSIPVLALNQVPNLYKDNLYQFALSPIDDVAELTRKASLDGHKKAVLLIPENDQSNRIASYFTQSWQAFNGVIVKKLTYDPQKADYAKLAKQLLELNQNQSADTVFLSAYSKEGRLINAQLQAQHAGNLAIYAMPTIYSGLTEPVSDAPLNAVSFCDIPWLFTGAYTTNGLSMMALRDVWQQFPGTYIRLVAMGIDAYELISKLPSLNSQPYSGATGNLSLASGNRIKRNLVCAKFVGGQPELIGFTHSPGEGDNSTAKPSNTAPVSTVP